MDFNGLGFQEHLKLALLLSTIVPQDIFTQMSLEECPGIRRSVE